MFIELMPLLVERTVMLTVARISGTPEEVDGEMARNLGVVYVEENLRYAIQGTTACCNRLHPLASLPLGIFEE